MAEFFPGIDKIKYEGPESKNFFAFKYYDADKVVGGKTMRDWLKFAVCYWHTFRGVGSDPFGPGTIKRPWEDGSNSVDMAKKRMDVAFEFFGKLGNPYWAFHDRDIAPEGATLAESHKNLDILVAHAKQWQASSGVKLLWGTTNLFSNPRFMNGGATNPDANVVAYAAAQVKKAMEVTHELGGEGYVFWGGREGYMSLLNTDMKRELDHFGRFLQLAVDYKKEIGFTGTLLIEPKPKEPTKHQYDFDSATVMGFLRTYGLEKEYQINVEANHATLAGHTFEHDLEIASRYGQLGSIDANVGDAQLGWDTDQFNMDINSTTQAMLVVMNQGGLPVGINFDAKVRRESTDVDDMFIAHIGGMDAFARGLINASKIIEDGTKADWIKKRYSSFDSGIGADFEAGKVGFKELEKFALENGEPKQISGQQEKYEVLMNQYI